MGNAEEELKDLLETQEREEALVVQNAISARNQAYKERNQLVAFISKIFPSALGRHDESDTKCDDEWRNIVFVYTTQGQCSWHIHDSELELFSHLQELDVIWDGHTAEQKYDRLKKFHPLESGKRLSKVVVEIHNKEQEEKDGLA